MTYLKIKDGFKVEVQNSGTRDKCGDTIYSYKILSKKTMTEVKKFCIDNIMPAYIKEEMPHLFSNEIIEFKCITNLNNEMGEIYIYTVKKHNTA